MSIRKERYWLRNRELVHGAKMYVMPQLGVRISWRERCKPGPRHQFCFSWLRLSLAKTLGVLSFTALTMLQACAQAVDFKVGHHFGEGQHFPGCQSRRVRKRLTALMLKGTLCFL